MPSFKLPFLAFLFLLVFGRSNIQIVRVDSHDILEKSFKALNLNQSFFPPLEGRWVNSFGSMRF